jgi:diguanylate cyclase (GGDEF)-like protein
MDKNIDICLVNLQEITKITKEEIANTGIVLPSEYKSIFIENAKKFNESIDDDMTSLMEDLIETSMKLAEKTIQQTFKLTGYIKEAKVAIINKDEDALSMLEKSFDLISLELSALREKAYVDPLTKTMNRAWIQEQIVIGDELLHNGIIVMIDLNNFKTTNDSFGHIVGDRVLVFIAKELKNIANKLSQDANVVRYGGDEFMLFVPDQNDLGLVNNKLTFLQEEMNKKTFKTKVMDDEIQFKTGFSFGCIMAKKGESFTEIIHEADQKMYNNKRVSKRS